MANDRRDGECTDFIRSAERSTERSRRSLAASLTETNYYVGEILPFAPVYTGVAQ